MEREKGEISNEGGYKSRSREKTIYLTITVCSPPFSSLCPLFWFICLFLFLFLCLTKFGSAAKGAILYRGWQCLLVRQNSEEVACLSPSVGQGAVRGDTFIIQHSSKGQP
jgi:hypothetical protein